MIWINNIKDLWINRKNPNEPCYCELAVYPNDIILQGQLSTNHNSGFSVQVLVYSIDGTTQYEDATNYFSFYVGVNPNGGKFFNLRCEEFSPAMCSYACYILRVIVSVGSSIVFDKYTEHYCQNDCCDIPRNISIGADTDDDGDTDPEITPDVEPIPMAKCGTPVITIRSVFDCIDNETAEYYGIPSTVLTGSANYSYEKITNFAGKIRREPREINRVISFNCKVQRSESFKPYVIEGTSIEALLPDWKLNELENQLHASYIEINDYGLRFGKKAYQYTGGTIGERAHPCWDVFRIKFNVQDCTVRTDFGCGECESATDNLVFMIPQGASGNLFYSEDFVNIGDYNGLKSYYESLGFAITDVSSSYDNIYAALQVAGSGIIPPFYYDYKYNQYKVYGEPNPSSPIILCPPVTIGFIYGEDYSCADFDFGFAYSDVITTGEVDILGYNNWTNTGGTVEYTQTTGKINLDTDNLTIIEDVSLGGAPIGIIEIPARPLTPQYIEISSDVAISIDIDGVIRYYGEPTTVTESGANITLNNIYYSRI